MLKSMKSASKGNKSVRKRHDRKRRQSRAKNIELNDLVIENVQNFIATNVCYDEKVPEALPSKRRRVKRASTIEQLLRYGSSVAGVCERDKNLQVSTNSVDATSNRYDICDLSKKRKLLVGSVSKPQMRGNLLDEEYGENYGAMSRKGMVLIPDMNSDNSSLTMPDLLCGGDIPVEVKIECEESLASWTWNGGGEDETEENERNYCLHPLIEAATSDAYAEETSVAELIKTEDDERDTSDPSMMLFDPGPMSYTNRGKPFLKCPACSAISFTANSCRRHFFAHVYKDGENYVCAFCEYSKLDPNALWTHLSMHDNQCESCGENLGRKNSFQKHWTISSITFANPVKRDRRGYYVCSVCKAIFSSLHHLSKHSFKHSCNEEKIHQCCTCSGTFSRRELLKNHKCLKCPTCGKLFDSFSRLKSHANTLNHILRCQICLYEFVLEVDHERHLTMHKKVYRPCKKYSHCLEAIDGKSFQCELCNKIFYALAQLNSHIRTDHCVEVAEERDENATFPEIKEEPLDYCIENNSNGEEDEEVLRTRHEALHRFLLLSHVVETKTRNLLQSPAESNIYECASCKKLYSDVATIRQHIKTQHTLSDETDEGEDSSV